MWHILNCYESSVTLWHSLSTERGWFLVCKGNTRISMKWYAWPPRQAKRHNLSTAAVCAAWAHTEAGGLLLELPLLPHTLVAIEQSLQATLKDTFCFWVLMFCSSFLIRPEFASHSKSSFTSHLLKLTTWFGAEIQPNSCRAKGTHQAQMLKGLLLFPMMVCMLVGDARLDKTRRGHDRKSVFNNLWGMGLCVQDPAGLSANQCVWCDGKHTMSEGERERETSLNDPV